MRDAGHRTPDIGHRTAKKAKIIYPPPRGVDIITGNQIKWISSTMRIQVQLIKLLLQQTFNGSQDSMYT